MPTTTRTSANLLEPATENRNNAADSGTDGLNWPVASMDRVFTVLSRCAMNERTCRTEASEVAFDVLERRTVLGREVVPHAAVNTARKPSAAFHD